jgi:prefoldin alpha subunit
MVEQLNEQKAAEQIYYEWVQRVQYMEKLLEDLDANMKSAALLKEQLTDLQNVKGGEDMLAPLANGIFVEATIKNPDKLKVNIGKGVLTEKTIQETMALVEKQEQEIRLTRDQVLMKLEELYEMAKQY